MEICGRLEKASAGDIYFGLFCPKSNARLGRDREEMGEEVRISRLPSKEAEDMRSQGYGQSAFDEGRDLFQWAVSLW